MATLTVRIAAEIEDLRKGLQEASKSIEQHAEAWQATGMKLTVAGAAIVAAVGATVAAAVKFGSEMHTMSQRTGISAEALAKLKYAAEQSGASFESLTSGLKFLSRNMADAAGGTGEAAQAFKALGISVKDAEGNLRPANEVLLEAADKLKGVENDTQRTALALKLFGRGATELIPMLREGAAGIEKLGQEAERLGIVMDDKAAAAAERLGDQLAALKGSVTGIAINIGAALLPVIERLVNAAINVTTRIVAWIRENEDLVRIIGTVALIIGGLITTVGTFALGAAVAMKAVALLTAAIALLTSPVGLVIAGIVALGIAIAAAIRYFDDFSRAAKGLGQIIAGLLLLLSPAGIFMWRTALDLMRAGWDNLKTGVSGAVSGITRDVQSAFDSVKGIFAGAGESVSASAEQTFGVNIPTSVAKAKAAFTDFGSATAKLSVEAQQAWINMAARWTAMAASIAGSMSEWKNTVVTAVQGAVATVVPAIQQVEMSLEEALPAFAALAEAAGMTFAAAVEKAGQMAQQFKKTIWEVAAQAVITARELGLTLAQAFQRVTDDAAGARQSIDWFEVELQEGTIALNKYAGALLNLRDPWQEGMITPAGKAKEAVAAFVEGSKTKFDELRVHATRVFEEITQAIASALGNWIVGFKTFEETIAAIWNALREAIARAIARIVYDWIMSNAKMLANWIATQVAIVSAGLSAAIAMIWASLFKTFGIWAWLFVALALAAVAWATGLIKMGKGGIAMEPTAAMIGEAGPEAVIPLRRLHEFMPGSTGNDRQLTQRLDRLIDLLDSRLPRGGGTSLQDIKLDRESGLRYGLRFAALGV